ncbi:MAG: hypothetical protein OXD44_02310 [Gammaproteobacteria bacterium]|nr:hypothetical protein [Gammaproteobacteria bacterium]MCY4226956.1 hypothetical protein [Gammaproteobacteria bacterium]MCY4312524.1 hypothetical protein [Gammaproteobacteria bacterium]
MFGGIDLMALLNLHNEPIKEEWLDAHGHLNEAYYLVPFSNAARVLQDHLLAKRSRPGRSKR